MPIYTADRQNHWPRILSGWSFSLACFLLAIVSNHFFPGRYTQVLSWALGVATLIHLIDLISRARIYKIVIDEKGETFSQYYRSPISGEGEKIILLDHVRVYIKKKKNSTHPEGLPTTIEFYKEYRRILNLSTSNDGFSTATLQEIIRTLKNLGLNITE